MKTFKADIALLPVSGTYVMTATEAVKAAIDIKPKMQYQCITTQSWALRMTQKDLQMA